MAKDLSKEHLHRVDSVLLEIESVLEKARGARNQIEAEINQSDHYGGGYELPEEALEGHLGEAATLLTVALDLAGLDGTQRQLASKWKSFEDSGISKTHFHPEVDWLESPPLEYLQHVIKGVRLVTGNAESLRNADQIKLEQLLRDTSVLLKRRNFIPKSEHDIQTVMHDYLGAYFPSYTETPHVHGSLKIFKPDGGIIALKTAIEFKFACSRTEITTALGGIFEDISGYAGSDDWTTFYSVVYQAEPFVSESRFRSEFDRAGAHNWFPILVNGAGSRPRRKAKTSSSKKRSKSVPHP